MLKKVGTEDQHFMIPFIGQVQKRQIYRDREQISSCLELGVGVGSSYRQTQENFWPQ